MRVIFSFDDGRDDAFNASTILKQHNLVGTFHITTGFIDGTFHSKSFGPNRQPLKISELVQMKNMGMEISSHGDKHTMNVNDFLVSYDKICEMHLNSNFKIGFSVPHSRIDTNVKKSFLDMLTNVLLYIRVGRSKKCYSFSKKVMYYLYHKTHKYKYFSSFNKPNILRDIDRYNLNSIVIKNDTKIDHIIEFLKKYSSQDVSVILMFHSIVDNPTNEWEYSKEDFVKLCDFCANERKIYNLTISKLIEESYEKI